IERVALERGDHRPEEIADRLYRPPGEIDEDEAGPHLAVHGHQAVAALFDVEELALLLDERQRTVKAIAPPVGFAHELPAGRLRFFAGEVAPRELVAPVAADVVERADRPVAVAHDDDRCPGDRDLPREVAADRR